MGIDASACRMAERPWTKGRVRGALLLAAVVSVGGAAPALADGMCEPYGPRHRGHHDHHHHHRGGSRWASCGPLLRPSGGCYRSYGGTPWSTIRHHLSGAALIRYNYIRGYFLRRYGTFIADGGHFGRPDAEGGGIWVAADPFVDPIEDDAVLAAADGTPAAKPAVGDPPRNPVDPIDRLNRGIARFHHGLYDDARADFGAVASARPDLPAALVGRTFTSIVAADWIAARRDLNRLAEAGELRADDRLVVEEVFAEPERVASMRGAAETWLRLRPTDASARLVTGWLLMLLGEEEAARSHLRLASDGPAKRALLGLPTADPAPAPADAPIDHPVPRREFRGAPPVLPPAIASTEPARGA